MVGWVGMNASHMINMSTRWYTRMEDHVDRINLPPIPWPQIQMRGTIDPHNRWRDRIEVKNWKLQHHIILSPPSIMFLK